MLLRKPSFWLLPFGALRPRSRGYGLGVLAAVLFHHQPQAPARPDRLLFRDHRSGRRDARHLVRRLARRPPGGARPGAYALVPGIAFLLTAPLYFVALNNEALGAGLVLYTIPYMLSLAWLGPVVNAVQHLVPPAMRATASASMLLINNLIGIGFGTFIFGYLSDRLTPVYGSMPSRCRSSMA